MTPITRRICRFASRAHSPAVLTGEDVTVPDAEFVYEGADEFPGRPQNIVDTLLAANDAYDTMAITRIRRCTADL